MTAARPKSPFGVELEQLRGARGFSQLRLASEAAMSPRYLSFIETGRSRPSRKVVLRLSDALGASLREKNRLLIAAGLSPLYPERSFDSPDLSPYRAIVEALLRKHEPYPAFVFDRSYRIVETNRAAHRILAPFGSNWIDAMFGPAGFLRTHVENFAEVAWAAYEMIRAERPAPDDVVRRLERHLEGVSRPDVDAMIPVVSPRMRIGDRTVTTITTIARFGAARDVLLDDLRVELVFPADEESARFFEELAGSTVASRIR